MNQITFQNVYQTTTVQGAFRLGQRASTPDGREWVYVQASAAVQAYGIVVPAAVTTVGTTISSSTDALGRTVYITKASAGWTVGAFADGTVHIDAGTGEGQVAKIKTNTTDTLELYPETALATALSTDSTMKVWTQNLVRKSLVTTKIQSATGIAQVAFAANEYGWVLTRGIGGVITSSTLTVAGGFIAGGATAGEGLPATTGKGTLDEQALGVCLTATTSVDKASMVFVSIY